jgi:MFS transporter, DHA1 family, multidrug resistance protein
VSRRASRRRDSKPRLGRDVIVLGIVAFFVMVGFGVVVPVLPVFVRSFGVGYLEIGAVVSAFALMRLVSSPFCGWLINRGGERTVLAIGIGIVAISSALVGVAQNYPQVLILRGAGGIGSAMFSVSAMTLLLGSTAPAIRGRAVGFYQGGFLIGGMAGPALGGVLAIVSLRAPFFFYAGTLAIAGLIAVFLLKPRAIETTDAAASPAIPFREVLHDRRYRAACLANFAQGWAALGVRTALVPVLIVEALHYTPTWTGIAFAIAAVAQTLALGPAGTFVDKVGRKPAIIGAFSVGALALFAVPFAPNMLLLIALLCVYGIAAAFMGTAPAASVGDAAGARSGTPVAIFSMFSDFGAIVGPLVAGWLVDVWSFSAAFGLAAALMLVASAYALRMPRAVISARRAGAHPLLESPEGDLMPPSPQPHPGQLPGARDSA